MMSTALAPQGRDLSWSTPGRGFQLLLSLAFLAADYLTTLRFLISIARVRLQGMSYGSFSSGDMDAVTCRFLTEPRADHRTRHTPKILLVCSCSFKIASCGYKH